MTVALSAGQMYAAERRHTPKWKFRIEGFPHAKRFEPRDESQAFCQTESLT